MGTVRRNRIPNCKLPTEDSMKKVDRGSSFEYVCDYDGVEVSSVAWKDNKTVLFAINFYNALKKVKTKNKNRTV